MLDTEKGLIRVQANRGLHLNEQIFKDFLSALNKLGKAKK